MVLAAGDAARVSCSPSIHSRPPPPPGSCFMRRRSVSLRAACARCPTHGCLYGLALGITVKPICGCPLLLTNFDPFQKLSALPVHTQCPLLDSHLRFCMLLIWWMFLFIHISVYLANFVCSISLSASRFTYIVFVLSS